ncbi:hypothetical protein ES708_17242 [subsurface metagenome]
MGWSLIIIPVNFQIAILLVKSRSCIKFTSKILLLICEIAVPGLFKEVGIIIKEAAIKIATDIIIKNFLFSWIKFFPLDKRKSKNIKSKETPNAR